MRVQEGVSAGSCSRRSACDEPSAAALFLETRCRAEKAAMRDYYYAGRSAGSVHAAHMSLRAVCTAVRCKACGVVCRSD